MALNVAEYRPRCVAVPSAVPSASKVGNTTVSISLAVSDPRNGRSPALADVAASLAAAVVGEVTSGAAALVGAVAGVVSWGLRRVLVLEPAMATLRGQAGAAVGSVLIVGAVLHAAATVLA